MSGPPELHPDLIGLAPLTARAEPAAGDAAKLDFFEKRIRPLLVANCYNCHSANTNSKGGLRVDDRNGLLNGGNEGPAIVPGEPEKSRLIRAVRQVDLDLKPVARSRSLWDENLHVPTPPKDDEDEHVHDRQPCRIGQGAIESGALF